MTGRRPRPKDGNQYDPLTLTLTDAVEAASEAADEASLVALGTISGRSGIGTVFEAAMAAVAGTKPGKIGPGVFDAALRAANDALADSSIPANYDRVRRAVTTIPDRLVRVAARQAAADLFAGMPAKDRAAGGGRLLDRMRTAAIRAARTRLERDEYIPAVRAAAEGARGIADGATRMTSDIITAGAPVHAATAAVFGVAIRGVPPGRLADAVEKACRDLPGTARRHDDLVTGFVRALSGMIAADAAYRRKYQTAARGAEKMARNEAATQMVNMIIEGAFEAVYMALVVGAYATSEESYFGPDYGSALAGACGLDPRRYQPVGPGGAPDAIKDIPDDIPVEVLQELHQKLSATMAWVTGSEEDLARQRMFRSAQEVDYKRAASLPVMQGIISLYGAAYQEGYGGAASAASGKRGGRGR